VFDWVKRLGNIDREEMFRVFNMGIGFVLVVRERSLDEVQQRLEDMQVATHVIGHVAEGDRAVTYLN
jgi:phosphoribosylformylglycinamidine cyclo-ligase